jgi:hypothetical protein
MKVAFKYVKRLLWQKSSSTKNNKQLNHYSHAYVGSFHSLILKRTILQKIHIK